MFFWSKFKYMCSVGIEFGDIFAFLFHFLLFPVDPFSLFPKTPPAPIFRWFVDPGPITGLKGLMLHRIWSKRLRTTEDGTGGRANSQRCDAVQSAIVHGATPQSAMCRAPSAIYTALVLHALNLSIFTNNIQNSSTLGRHRPGSTLVHWNHFSGGPLLAAKSPWNFLKKKS